mgnify:CR=1 FL=1
MKQTFIENFEKEIDLKGKIHISEHNQLAKIAESFQNYLSEMSLEIKPVKVVGGNHPVAYFDFKKKVSDDTLINWVCEYFKSSSIAFRKHKFNGSYPLFSLKNYRKAELLLFLLLVQALQQVELSLGLQVEEAIWKKKD